MAVTSTRAVTLVYTGDVAGTQVLASAANTSSAGQFEVRTLASGFTAISVPTAGTVPTALTIFPPTGNTTSITLKGVTGDTGIRLHNTDPTSIAIDSSVTSIGLTTGAEIIGVRLYWS